MTRAMCTMFALTVLAGCHPAAKAPVHDTFTRVALSKADSSIATLQYGAKSGATKPNGDYGWFQFSGNIGDAVDIWVRSPNGGDAVGFLLDANDDVIAANDDGGYGSADAHVTATLPADGIYYIAFRDYYYSSAAQFTVELQGSGVFTCKSDVDCVAVAKAGCCNNGYLESVNASELDSYNALYACSDSAPVCSHLFVQDKRIAECSNLSHKCEMIDPSMIQCGGNMVNAHHCPDGWHCDFHGRVPDIAGSCVQ